MSRIQKIKDSPHYLRLKESVEYRYDKKQFIIIAALFGGLFVFMLLMLLPVMIEEPDSGAAGAGIFVMALFLLPLILYLLYHWLEIFLYIDSYVFREVVLDRPQVAGRGGVKYTVSFTDRHGKQLTRETSRLFTSQTEPYLEDYNNKIVLIGYNEETDRVVVIKRLDG